MQVQVAALCDSASDYSGKLCLLGAFDTLFARQFPVVHPHCALALRFCFFAEDEGEHKLSIRFLNADGHPVTKAIEPRINIQLSGDAGFITRNMVMNLQGLSFPKPGEYAVQIACDQRSLAEIPLRVMEVDQNQQG